MAQIFKVGLYKVFIYKQLMSVSSLQFGEADWSATQKLNTATKRIYIHIT